MIKKIVAFFVIALFCMPVYAKSKIKVYPNPWIPDSNKSLDTGAGDQMKNGAYTADGWVKFYGVARNIEDSSNYGGTLRIYDITGHLVRLKKWTVAGEALVPLPQTCDELKTDEDYGGIKRDHIVHWDGKNNDYEYVESGVYIWIIQEDDGQKHDGKLVVVR